MDENDKGSHSQETLRRWATWGVVVGTAVWATFFFGFLAISALAPSLIPQSWFLEMVQKHPVGTIGIAISAISSFSVVAVLDMFSRDPISFTFFNFELKGAAGPVVLWVICFLAFAFATDMLWQSNLVRAT